MTYPATIEVTTPDKIANWRAIAQFFMAIPHLIISAALEYVSGAIAVISWFVILFTGKLPAGLADFQVMIMRYTARVETYAGFLHDAYPPFEYTTSAADPGDNPVSVGLSPTLENRDRLTVGLRFLWVIPALLYAFVIAIVGMICWFLAFWAVLFTGRWPKGLRDWALKMLRVSIRVNAYMLLLTDKYPPFSTD